MPPRDGSTTSEVVAARIATDAAAMRRAFQQANAELGHLLRGAA